MFAVWALATVGAVTCVAFFLWAFVETVSHGGEFIEGARSYRRFRRERDELADRTEALEAELRELRESSPYRGRVLSEPDAAIKVVEYELTPEQRAGLNIGDAVLFGAK